MTSDTLDRATAERIAAEVYDRLFLSKFANLQEVIRGNLTEYVLAGMRHAASPVDLDAVRREAARQALTALAAKCSLGEMEPGDIESAPYVCGYDEILRHRDREYPAPAPDRVELSDGSVVTVDKSLGGFKRLNRDGFDASAAKWAWATLLNRDTDTGADFDALKAFAARVGGQP